MAGIGNAYSDEILWEARLAPFRRRSTLKPDDIDRLYHAMRTVLVDAVERLRVLVPPDIQTQHREFLKVHLRGGEPCPAMRSGAAPDRGPRGDDLLPRVPAAALTAQPGAKGMTSTWPMMISSGSSIPFAACSAETLLPKRWAMAASVSPCCTT